MAGPQARTTNKQEAVFTVTPPDEAAAEHAAGAERDLGLQDVVAGAHRVALGIEKGQHPLALVVVQPRPEHGQGAKPGGRGSADRGRKGAECRGAEGISRQPLRRSQ